jgi:hypothetical protein
VPNVRLALPFSAATCPSLVPRASRLGIHPQGKQTWRVADHEEVFEAGDAFYVGPGHVPVFEAGTELIQFSPTEEQKATDEAVRRYMEENT